MPPTTKKSFLKNEVRFYIFKEHLTKGTKILRIKSQVRAVKGIRIKHCKYMQEFVVLLQARPHCHLLNRGKSLGLLYPEFYLPEYSFLGIVAIPSHLLRAVWQQDSSPFVSQQHRLLWHPPTGENEAIGWQADTIRH